MDDASKNKNFIQIAKCWQREDNSLIFQCKLRFKDAHFPKKFFLIADPNQKTRGFRFVSEKPDNLKVGGLAVNLTRKHIPSASIKSIKINKDTKEIWMSLFSSKGSSHHWYILINKNLPPDVSLISDDNVSYFRVGQKGSYGKKLNLQTPRPDLDLDLFEDQLSSLLDEIKTSELGYEDSEEPDNGRETQGDEIFSLLQNKARKRLKRRIKTVEKSINKLEKKTPKRKDIEELEVKLRLLQTYSYLIKRDDLSLHLSKDMTHLESDIEIEIDPDYSVGKNIDNYFKKLKKLKSSLKIGQKKIIADKKNLFEMGKDFERLQKEILTESEVLNILNKHKITIQEEAKTHTTKKNISKPYRTYKPSETTEILVGKSPQDNDELTKYAKSNDYWFHIIGTTGSHVILPHRVVREELPESLKRQAAILAVHFSKLRQDQKGEVYFTQKRNLRKRKGMPAGLWLVEKSETYFVSYDKDELKTLLESQKIE